MATQAAHVIHRPFEIDPERDALLTPFGRATLADRYLLPGEGPQDLFARVARAYADDSAHAQRLYDYMSKLWFMPATPILSNGGTDRGLPISCFLNAVEDDLGSIVDTWSENVWLAQQRRRHRHLLGRRALDRRARARLRPYLGNHSIRARHGLADAGDLARLAAARVCGRLHRRAPSRDRGVHRDSQAVRRLQPQEPEPASRRLHHGRVHARRARRRAVHAAQPADRRGAAPGLGAAALAAAARNSAANRRAVSAVHRHGESAACAAPTGRGPHRPPVESLQRDPAADRPRPHRPHAHGGVLPRVGESRALGRMVRRARISSRTCCGCSTTCSQDFIERRAGQHGGRALLGAPRTLRGLGRHGLSFLFAAATASRSRARSRAPRTCACSAPAARRRPGLAPHWRPSAAPAPTRPSAAWPNASATSSRSHRRPASASSAAARAPASSRSRRTSTRTKRCRGPSASATGATQGARGTRASTRRTTWQSILAHEGSVQHLEGLSERREGRVPHGVRDRPALGRRARRRPRAAASARASR